MTGEMRLAFAELKVEQEGKRGEGGAQRPRKEGGETKATLGDGGPGEVASHNCQYPEEAQ